jgi:hypothetical protein
MRSRLPVILVLGALLAGCGGNSVFAATTSTTVATATTVATTTIGGTTATVPTTATTMTTTTPTDTHPVIGLSWAAVFPPEGATATYRVTTYGGATLDLPGRVEYGVEWRGGTWDRFVIGTPEPGDDAMVVYFDRSEPWSFKIKGDEAFSSDRADGPELVEIFDEPVGFDGLLLPEGVFETETAITLEFGGGGSATMGVTYRLEALDLGEDVEVAAGLLRPTVRLHATIGGELMGGAEFAVDMWLHPTQFMVKMTDGPAFATIELLTAWE